MENTPQSLARYIDHTLLQPQATAAMLTQACDEARQHGFYSVCVYWDQVDSVAQALHGSPVLPIAVVGFPLGTEETPVKVQQTQHAVALGAQEIDMVINRTLLCGGKDQKVVEDIRAVVEAAKVPVKVILETSELTDAQKRRACELAREAGAAFVKTSTGFSSQGATSHDVALMRGAVGTALGVKASGGIRTLEKAREMIQAGANRLGTSASVAIVQGQAAQGSGY